VTSIITASLRRMSHSAAAEAWSQAACHSGHAKRNNSAQRLREEHARRHPPLSMPLFEPARAWRRLERVVH
jgi:hypothetical protein